MLKFKNLAIWEFLRLADLASAPKACNAVRTLSPGFHRRDRAGRVYPSLFEFSRPLGKGAEAIPLYL